MHNILTSAQMRKADDFTITQKPIASIDLMEQASKAFIGYFSNHFPDKKKPVVVFCGTGNNGGDGLAIARLLKAGGYEQLSVLICRFSEESSDNFLVNFDRLKLAQINFIEIFKNEDLPEINPEAIIIDAILGSGLNKPLQGKLEKLVGKINSLKNIVVAVDVPTGFYTDEELRSDATVFKADLTITFQRPKLNFFLPESISSIKKWEVVDIGLDEEYLQSVQTPYKFIDEKGICQWLKPRQQFDHKGTFGHAFLVAGQAETMGAALLCSEACINTGAGLTTVCIPESGLTALNTRLPEAMAFLRKKFELPEPRWDRFSAVAVGPGLGTDEASAHILRHVLHHTLVPVVIDADGLNLLGQEKDWQKRLPEKSILTPHVKEFDRLFGPHKNWWQRIKTGQEKAVEMQTIIVLKNRYTFIFNLDGEVYINPTGNPAMATGGMGDALTGVILALLAQDYSPVEAAVIGVYLHGKTGDELAFHRPKHVVLPTELAAHIPFCLAKMLQKKNDRT